MKIKKTLWIDATKDQPKNSNPVLGAWVKIYGDVPLWEYTVVRYNRYNQHEWMKDNEVIQVEYWQNIESINQKEV